jgi:hypothetical protein
MPLLSPPLSAMNKRLVIPGFVNENISNPEFETKECKETPCHVMKIFTQNLIIHITKVRWKNLRGT